MIVIFAVYRTGRTKASTSAAITQTAVTFRISQRRAVRITSRSRTEISSACSSSRISGESEGIEMVFNVDIRSQLSAPIKYQRESRALVSFLEAFPRGLNYSQFSYRFSHGLIALP